MPKLPERYAPIPIAASIGGSALFSDSQRFYHPTLESLLEFFSYELKENHAIIAVVGGGPEARIRRDEAKIQTPGITDRELDQIGIAVTVKNATLLAEVLSNTQLVYEMHDFGKDPSPGVIYVRGGTRPGRTTDAVAIEAANTLNLKIVLNISEVRGLHPIEEGRPNPKLIIPDITWGRYARMFPQKYSPGMRNVPIDPVAAELAHSRDMSVILIGPRAANLIACLNGEDFEGTIIHP